MQRIYTLFAAVTPSDTLPPAPFPVNGIYVGGTGDLAVRDRRGVVTTFEAVPVGAVIPIATDRVMAATTATLIVALGDVPVGTATQ